MKIYVKGNFVALVDGLGDIWMDNCENVIMNITGLTSYALFMNGINKVNHFVFSDVDDELGNPYASQDIFEEYIYSNTGVRFQAPLVLLNDLSDVNITSPLNKDLLSFDSILGKWENSTITEILGYTPVIGGSQFQFIYAKTDLPIASSGVIILANNVTYYFTTTIDLTGDRLLCGANTTILGGSSENCVIKSTGLSSSTALITSSFSLPIRNITITHGTALNLTGDGTTTALDWFGVNFTDCATVGTIANYTNFVMSDSAFLNSGNLTFDGTIGTIGMSNCLFDCASTSTALIFPSTLTISRRIRIIYSSFIVLSGETGINVNASAVISSERYILDTVNFSGGGTYTSGVTYTDNKALFVNCVGITNTSTKGFMYMLNNTTDTSIGVSNVNVWVKATGTTTSGTNSKFTHTTNRLTYNGAFTNSFLVTLNTTVRCSVSNQSISIGVAKNGTIITESEGIIRTATSNVEHGGSTQAVLEMVSTDYIELFVRNTGSTDIRVTDFNFNVVKIPV